MELRSIAKRVLSLYMAGSITRDGILKLAEKKLISREEAEYITADSTSIAYYAKAVSDQTMKLEDVPAGYRTSVAIKLGE